MSSDYIVTIGKRQLRVKIVNSHLVEVDGHRWDVDFVPLSEARYSLLMNNAVVEVVSSPLVEEGRNGFARNTMRIMINKKEFTAIVDDHRSLLLKSLRQEEGSTSGSLVVTSPMPGRVVKIEVQEGEEVQEGRGLVVLEAMKMENELKAPVRGRVMSIHVRGGTSVEKGEKLLTIESI